MLLTTITPTADILGNPQDPDIISNNDSQLLYGEQFMVEESRGAYVYGHSVLDGYKGSVERVNLIKDTNPENAIIKVRKTHLYMQPNFKSRPVSNISFLSRVTTTAEQENGFTKLEDGYWIFTDHITALKSGKIPKDLFGDLAQIATLFLNTPYLYAGRSCFGIDCSGLVQLCVMAAGHPCPPRDARDQESVLGTAVKQGDIQRNDIVYFKGHVGIMMDDKYILNATARHMSTVIEELKALEQDYSGITHIRRLK